MLEASRKARTLRELRSVCSEVGGNDPEAFADLVEIRAEFDRLIRVAADQLRTEGEYSWASLARPLGLTRSAVQQRYGFRVGDHAPVRA